MKLNKIVPSLTVFYYFCLIERRNKMIKIVISSVIIVLLALKLDAWSCITHYAIGKDLGYSDMKSGNMNLPDCWESNSWGKITDWFTWTRTGSTNLIPNVPQYPYDGRYPGPIIYLLATKKIAWKNKTELQLAKLTAIGFVGHNAADKIVHWSYFLGGATLDNWKIHHADKELWADYWIWIIKGVGKFGKDGKSKEFFGKDVKTTKTLIPLFANFKVIMMAQKVAVKNRRIMDIGTKNYFTSTENISKISNRIEKYEKRMTKDIKAMNINEFKKLLKKANKYNWTLKILNLCYNKSVNNANIWIKKYCR